MKTWKIKNLSSQQIKFVSKVGNQSKGIILKPNEICIIEPQKTAYIDAQERRRFLSVDRDFYNNKYQLPLATPLSEEAIFAKDKAEEDVKKKAEAEKSKIEIAQEDTEKYINKEEE